MSKPALDRWTRVWRPVTNTGDAQAVYQDLISRYSEAHRHYHNLSHIADCLREFDLARHLAHDSVALELAIWFHDAIYDTHAPDNEGKSAELAQRHLTRAGASAGLIESVAALVLATKAHQPSAHQDAPLLIDLDLSILGQSKERFRQYESQIRSEYDWVPASTFAARRAEILKGFLTRQRIYTTEPFFTKYENRARANLQASIQTLETKS